MKIFLSWYGHHSKAVPEALNAWLKRVIQAVKPFYSPEIEKGAKWSNQLNAVLEGTNFDLISCSPEKWSELFIVKRSEESCCRGQLRIEPRRALALDCREYRDFACASGATIIHYQRKIRMNKQDMSGRVALITGASTGIGRWAAIAMAECGAAVAINYHKNQAGAEETLKAVEAAGGRGIIIQADVSTKAGAESVVAAARTQLGPLDILVNNAGDLVQRCSLREFTEELWDRVMNLNLKSVWLVSQAAMGEMIERKAGTIINVGSIAGHHGGGPGAAVYATTKAGVHCLTKGMAKELAPFGIRVNAVAPGVIETPFHERMSTPEMMKQFAAGIPLGRTGIAEECGRVIAFLASDAASYIHGEMIEINGGQLMV